MIRIYTFGEFELDDALCELRLRGLPVAVMPKAFDLLSYLVAHADRVVVREELVRCVWRGVVVTGNAITQAVTNLRRILEGDGRPPAIATIRGRGYRFVQRVTSQPTPAPSSVRCIGTEARCMATPVQLIRCRA
jgi:DNA-binding winged helix-turn-helix (wHTH) protein